MRAAIARRYLLFGKGQNRETAQAQFDSNSNTETGGLAKPHVNLHQKVARFGDEAPQQVQSFKLFSAKASGEAPRPPERRLLYTKSGAAGIPNIPNGEGEFKRPSTK